MKKNTKTKEELIKELKELQQENNSLKALYDKDITNRKQAKQGLIFANKELAFQNEEKEKRAAELVIADKELVFQTEEKEKRAAELVIANKELTFQNEEKEKRAAELIIANKELVFQNKEKEKRAAELIIANKELVFQNKEKEKRAAELLIANKELEQFAYVVSHDLQEPLRMVASFTQLLERRYKDKLDQDANDFIKYAVDGANRMQKLINDLLDYSRTTSRGKDFAKVDISQVLGQTISNLQKLIIENNALITNEDLPELKADESQIIRVFQNLIENAIKFKKKSELPKIHISCKKKNKFYEFAVRDNGIGIDMQFHNRVFTIFQRLHTKEEYPGTGIGLSICKRIIERHGGKIWFESKENEGTTFYFTLKK
jgi:signal transduction histidine kinase